MDNTCNADPCYSDKIKEKEKRIIKCSSPGCHKQFHVGCVGHGKCSDKELKNLFFVCSRCEMYLNYSADIARKSFMDELEARLDTFKKDLFLSIDNKIREEKEKIIQHNESLALSLKTDIEESLNELKKQTTEANDFALALIKDNEQNIRKISKDQKRAPNNPDICETESASLPNVHHLYLASIDVSDTNNDIAFLLKENKLDLTDVTILSARGSFKKKKYVIVSFLNREQLLRFKMSYMNCMLAKTWYLLDKPPLSPDERKTKQSTTTISYRQNKSQVNRTNKQHFNGNKFATNRQSVNNNLSKNEKGPEIMPDLTNLSQIVQFMKSIKEIMA